MSERSLTEGPEPSEVDEASLTDAAAEPEGDEADLDALIEDATDEPDEADYDFGAFVAGVRPTRRAVVIYQNNDLRADIDLLDEKIRITRMAGDDASQYEELRKDAAQILLDSGKKVIVQAKNTDWQKQFLKDMKAKGLNPDAKKFKLDRSKLSDDAQLKLDAELMDVWDRIKHEQIAAQIVHPKTGVTAEAVAELAANSEQEIDKLWQALVSANRQPGVSPDFLAAHSGTRRPGSR